MSDRGHTPAPTPGDTCAGCGRRRGELPEDVSLQIEVLHGDGSADWLCSRCDDRGRGLK